MRQQYKPVFSLAIAVIAMCFLFIGCDDARDPHAGHDHGDDGDHVHKASNGGKLIEIGDHFANIEVKYDKVAGSITAWTTGPHAEHPSRLKQETIEATVTVDEKDVALTLKAVASELTGETVGDTSQFMGQSDELKDHKHLDIAFGKIEIRGETFTDVKGHLHPH